MPKLKGSSEWGPIYMLIVMLIAAILIITLVKPMFKNAQSVAQENIQQTQTAAKALLFLMIPLVRRK